MGKKSKQGKEKKLARKKEMQAEDAVIAAKQQLCHAANAMEDPMKDLSPLFKKFDRNGLNVGISCSRVKDLDTDTMEFIFALTKTNMESLYNDSEGGWIDKDKRQELSEDEAWHMLARDEAGKLYAFVHFRFDMDEGDNVLYCYEIQLIKEAQRKGLGKFLMQILEIMALKHSMEKVMMTVFKHNTCGQKFFRSTMKYTLDETSPTENMVEALYDEDGYTYQILSKIMPAKKKPLSLSNTNTQAAAVPLAAS